MKIKGDFVTNSSSTNYVVEEYFQGEMKRAIFENFGELIKKFFDYIKEVYGDPSQTDDVRKIDMLKLNASIEKDALKFSAEHIEDYLEIQFPNDTWLYGLKTEIETHGKNLSINLHYVASQEAKMVDDVTKQMTRQMLQDIFEEEDIEILHSRKIVDYQGDGWDGGDPCFGYYGESDKCAEEVEVKETISM